MTECVTWKGHTFTPEEAAELHKMLSFYLQVGGAELAKRTEAQNSAMHVWLRWVAKELNERGLDIQTVLAEAVERPWTEHSAKELLWRPIQDAMYGKESTTKISKQECSEIYEVLNRHLSAKFGVYVPWPEDKTK